jgi:hypothetical protein
MEKPATFEEWLEWSKANPEPECEPACECERRDKELRDIMMKLTPEDIERATEACFGKHS